MKNRTVKKAYRGNIAKRGLIGGLVAGGLMVAGAALVPPKVSSGQARSWAPWEPSDPAISGIGTDIPDVLALTRFLPPDSGRKSLAEPAAASFGPWTGPTGANRSSGGGKGRETTPPSGGLPIGGVPTPPAPPTGPNPTLPPVPSPTLPPGPNPTVPPAPNPTLPSWPNPSPSGSPSPSPSPSQPTPTSSPLPVTPPDTEGLLNSLAVALDQLVMAPLRAQIETTLTLIDQMVLAPVRTQIDFVNYLVGHPSEISGMVLDALPGWAKDALGSLTTQIQAMVTQLEAAIGQVQAIVAGIEDMFAPGGEVEDAIDDAKAAAAQASGMANDAAGSSLATATATAAWAGETAGSYLAGAIGAATGAAEAAGKAASDAVAGAPGTVQGAIDGATTAAKPVTDAVGAGVGTINDTIQNPPAGGSETTTLNHSIRVFSTDPNGTAFPVLAGHRYSLRASGTYKWSAVVSLLTGDLDSLNADASCAQALGSAAYVHDIENHSQFMNANQLNLLVGGAVVDWAPVGATEADDPLCSQSHTYTFDVNGGAPMAADGVLVFRINDDNPTDDAGAITVDIAETFPTPEALRSGMSHSGPIGWVLIASMAAAALFKPVRRRVRS